MITRLFLFFFFLSFAGFCQYGSLMPLLEQKPTDSILKASYKFHPAIQPVLLRSEQRNDNIEISPSLDQLNAFLNSSYQYRAGIGFQSKIDMGQWFANIGYSYTYHNTDTNFLSPRAYLNSYNQGHNILGRVSYTPNEIFNFQAGIDRNFIGDGCRSLFLSDYGRPYPFGQIRANFWHVEYTSLYQFFREKSENDFWRPNAIKEVAFLYPGV